MSKHGADQLKRLFLAIQRLTSADVCDKSGKVIKSKVAAFMGVSDQMLNNWSGDRGISKEGLVTAQKLTGCSLAWLEDGEGQMVHSTIYDETPAATQYRFADEPHSDRSLETLIRYMPGPARTMTYSYIKSLLTLMEENPQLFADKKQMAEWVKWSKKLASTGGS